MTYPPVVVVNAEDEVIGSAPLAEVLAQGLYHRIVSVHVQDENGAMLLQLRGPDVMLYPNCWDQAVGGHVDEGFTYEQAALAELEEELGITGAPLEAIDTYLYQGQEKGKVINQFVRVYRVKVPHSVALTVNANEVAKVQWINEAEIKTQLLNAPERFTPGYAIELQKYFFSS